MIVRVRMKPVDFFLVQSVGFVPCPPATCTHCKKSIPAEIIGMGKIGLALGPTGKTVLYPVSMYDIDEGEYDPSLPLDVVSYRTDAKGKVIIGYRLDEDGNIVPD